MGNYKLIYFDGHGRGELIRMTFKLAKVDFIDERVKFDEWPKLKPSTPTGVLPYLETPEGEKLVQSMAILRHLGRKFNLVGKNETEHYEVDRALDQCVEFLDGLMKPIFGKNEAQAKAVVKEYMEERGARILKTLESYLKSNNLVVDSGLTIGDIAVINVTLFLNQRFSEHMKDLSLLNKHLELVKTKSPEISKWIAERPESAF